MDSEATCLYEMLLVQGAYRALRLEGQAGTECENLIVFVCVFTIQALID